MGGVTTHGIRYPDGASKAKNLGPELKTMAEDIDWYIGSYLSPTGPIRQIIIGVAEEVVPPIVEGYLDARNVVRAFPSNPPERTTYKSIPLEFESRPIQDRYSDSYAVEYQVYQANHGTRYGNVPVLTADGSLYPEAIPATVATRDYVDAQIAAIPDPPDVVENEPEKLPSVFWARLAAARQSSEPLAIMWTGSSTSMGPERYVGPTTRKLQAALWPEATPTPVQADRDAEFTEITTPGLHGYTAGDGGTTAQTYLTTAEMDRIAALNPAVIGHMVGSNDYANQQSPTAYKAAIIANINYLNSKLTRPAVHVLYHAYAILNFTPWAYSHAQYGQAMQEIAAEMGDGVIFVNLAKEYEKVGVPGSDPLDLIGEDNVHQTLAGYEFMSTLVPRILIP